MIQIWRQYFPYKRGIVTLNKSVINYLPRYTYHLLEHGQELFQLQNIMYQKIAKNRKAVQPEPIPLYPNLFSNLLSIWIDSKPIVLRLVVIYKYLELFIS